MSYDLDDAGAYLYFKCRYKGNPLEVVYSIWGLLVVTVFVAIVGWVIVPGFFSSKAVFSDGAFWTIGWFVVFLMALYLLQVIGLLWLFVGKETMEISNDDIVIKHQIFGVGISQRYRAGKIDGVFVTRNKDDKAWMGYLMRARQAGIASFKYGKVAINCGRYWLLGGPKTFRFGTSIEWDEATQIVSIIHNRFPHYQYKKTRVAQ